jgi:formate hydrogenlyase transcriptional activator
VFPIRVPSLRDRHDDIPLLAAHFLRRAAAEYGIDAPAIPPMTMRRLMEYEWPGNVRELENFIERSVILTNGSSLQAPISELMPAAAPGPSATETLERTERDHILKVLRETKGTLAGPTGAAARLGLKRTTLQYKMKKLGITRNLY